MPFSKPGLFEPMQCVVDAACYRGSTPIPQKTIPFILEGMDLIAQVQTGTGTTAASALPMHPIREEEWKHVLVFVSRKRAAKLKRDGVQACDFHGDLDQDERTFVLSQFKSRNIRVLAATDIAASGIDIQDISPVDYFHRIGAAPEKKNDKARAGAEGRTI